jgi:hypothetical protein
MTKPKRVLFLDDRSKRLHAALKKYAPPEYELTLVCTVKECIKMISNEPRWDIVSLDHDLGFEEFVNPERIDSGMEVIRWLTRNKISLFEDQKIPDLIIIHTSNWIAGTEMRLRLEELQKEYGQPLACPQERFEYD